MKISIIGGGNMGGAIARGLSQSSIVAPSEITVSNRGEEKLNELKSFNPSIHTTTDNKEAVKEADVIILAVKSGYSTVWHTTYVKCWTFPGKSSFRW